MAMVLWVLATILDMFAIYDVMNSRRDWATKAVLLAIILGIHFVLGIPFVGAGLYLLVFRDKSHV